MSGTLGPSRRIFALAVTVVTLGAVGLSIWMHPPSAYRADRLDQRRVSDLQQLVNKIEAYWRSNRALPQDMEALHKDIPINSRIISDPDTGEFYHYRVLSKQSYQLCASLSNLNKAVAHSNWILSHDDSEAPRFCFKFTVRPITP